MYCNSSLDFKVSPKSDVSDIIVFGDKSVFERAVAQSSPTVRRVGQVFHIPPKTKPC